MKMLKELKNLETSKEKILQKTAAKIKKFNKKFFINWEETI